MPLASNTSMATLDALSDDFLVRARVLRNAPNACALITASVPDNGGGFGEGERDERDAAALRRFRSLELEYNVQLSSLFPRSRGEQASAARRGRPERSDLSALDGGLLVPSR